MNSPVPVSIDVFTVTRPHILLKTDLISHPEAHIGLSIVNHYRDSKGVLVLLGTWLEQAKYETVNLYVNDNSNPVASEIVMDSSAAVELRLPMGLLVEGVNTFYCTVERLSGNIEKSQELKVLYFVYAPGGDDPVVGGGHSALGISVSPTSVDAAQAAQGVILTLDWPHKHLYDLVTVDCGGVPLTHRIEPTPLDPVPDLTKPLVLTLYTQHFANDPNNSQFPIRYNVISQTNNFSGTTHLGQFDARDHWSVPCLIDVHLDRKELEMPILREILTENNDDPTIVDLDKLKGGPLWALVHLIDAIWDVGDEIHLMFTALVNGSPVASHEATLPITQVPGQFAWDIPNDKVIVDSIVSVRFEQIRGGKVIGVSKVAEAQVIGEGTIKLLPPKLVAPAVSPIDLWLYSNGVTVRIEYLDARAGDKAQLIEINPPAGATPFPVVAFNTNKRTNTVLTQAFLAERQGSQLRFRWVLIRGGKEIARSGSLLVTVARIEDGDARLPVAEILQAKAGGLNLDDFDLDGTVRLLPWVFIAIGQSINVTVVDRNHAPLPVLQNHRITEQDVTNGLTQAISRPWLDALFDNAEITLKVEVTVGGHTVVFKDVNYIVSLRSYAGSEDFESSPLIGFNPGSVHTFASGITLKSLGGIVHLTNVHTTDRNYTSLLGRVTLNMLGTVEITLPGLASHVSFLFVSHQLHEENAVVYMDERGNVIGTMPLPYTSLYQYAYVSFSAPGKSRIKSIIIRNRDDMYVDKFEVR
ncbi:hypothetical protein [Pseudomonas sp. LjRoot263]|jgi:hypothetical protein|uniref:hypothetical protein n=1 Tax=Pseudomonas sp. LjRoot263 TaxID=3342302 RepID=UPI003ECE8B01